MLPAGIRVGSMASSNHHMHTAHPKGVMSIVGHYLATSAGDTHTLSQQLREKKNRHQPFSSSMWLNGTARDFPIGQRESKLLSYIKRHQTNTCQLQKCHRAIYWPSGGKQTSSVENGECGEHKNKSALITSLQKCDGKCHLIPFDTRKSKRH